MPFGSTFSPTFLTSHPDPRGDLREEPRRGDDASHLVILADGARVAVVREPELALFKVPSEKPGTVYLGRDGQCEVWASDAAGFDIPDGVEWEALRAVGPLISTRDANWGLTTVGMLAWHADHGYCGRCGAASEPIRHGWVRRCGNGHDHFPRTDPAVIVAITDGEDRLLLAKNVRTTTQMVSVLAGFVEPGEDFESAIAREVFEEVGLEVEGIEYRASQPWPYPRSLMIGFRARVKDGTDPNLLRLQESEIEHARWFTRAEFHEACESGDLVIPDGASIARSLINEWAGDYAC